MLATLAALAALCAALLAAAPARADDGDDSAALTLADQPGTAPRPAREWRAFIEVSATDSVQRGRPERPQGRRLSLDLQFDHRLARDGRLVLADRLDTGWQRIEPRHASVNTLKEAYLGWRLDPERSADLGRINVREGVAYAYNPTDWFRAGALRSVVSIDPASQRENRQGSVMLRGQWLWAEGALTAHWSPKLAERPNDASFALDLGATNRRDRWLLVASRRLAEGFEPQLLLYGEAGQAPQLGTNLTLLLGPATVAHIEAASGRAPSLAAQAGLRPDDRAWRTRLATGLGYTTATKLSFIAEVQFDGAAADRAEWQALADSASGYGRYRTLAGSLQEPATRRRLFLRAAWQDALLLHLDLTASLLSSRVDHSRQAWIDARYHWEHADLALQWRRQSGTPTSEFGAGPERRAAQVLGVWYF